MLTPLVYGFQVAAAASAAAAAASISLEVPKLEANALSSTSSVTIQGLKEILFGNIVMIPTKLCF